MVGGGFVGTLFLLSSSGAHWLVDCGAGLAVGERMPENISAIKRDVDVVLLLVSVKGCGCCSKHGVMWLWLKS